MITALRSHSIFRIIALIIFRLNLLYLKLNRFSANWLRLWLKNVCAIAQTSNSHLTELRNFRWFSFTYCCSLCKKYLLNLIRFRRSLIRKVWGIVYLLLIFLPLVSEARIFEIRDFLFWGLVSSRFFDAWSWEVFRICLLFKIY